MLVGTAIIFYRMSLGIIHLSVLLAGLFIVNFIAGNDSFYWIISFIFIGSAAGYSIGKKKKLVFFIFVSSLSIAFIFTINHYYLIDFKKIDLIQNRKDELTNLLKENNLPESEKKQIIQSIDESMDIIVQLIPFAYFLNSLVLSFLSLYFIKFIFNKFHILGEDKSNNNINGNTNNDINDSIEGFRIKEHLIFFFIAGWFIVLLVDRNTNYFLYMTGLNTALIFSCFYLIQSFGILKHLFVKKGIPFLLLPGFIIFFIFLGQEYFLFILVVLSGIGALDFWVDFRKLNPDAGNSRQ